MEKDGEYVWVVVKKEGCLVVVVFEEVLLKIIVVINFLCVMRWIMNLEVVFLWLFCWFFGVYGDYYLTFEVFGVYSGMMMCLLCI